jgi:hypothetical protein
MDFDAGTKKHMENAINLHNKITIESIANENKVLSQLFINSFFV